MKAEKTADFGHLAKALEESDLLPTLNISARVEGGMPGLSGPDDKKWRRTEAQRLRKEIKAGEEQLKNWDDAAVSQRAMKSLKTDLAVKRARLMESEALLGDDDEKPKKGKK